MQDNQLVTLSKEFAVEIIDVCEKIREERRFFSIVDQLLRSGTSIGANVHEANYASSKADFINKFQIALKECYETDYWLEIFHESHVISDEQYKKSSVHCSKIRKSVFVVSLCCFNRSNKQFAYLTAMDRRFFILFI